MKQYHKLLEDILNKGTYKAAARENMPGTISLFGYQMRFDLQEGFPIVTTKKVSFKNIVTELLWFLKGDTNIKYLVDNGCNIWNEDAYNYYEKLCKKQKIVPVEFSEFIKIVKKEKENQENFNKPDKKGFYTWGDCGKQYGWLWRNWSNYTLYEPGLENIIADMYVTSTPIDQIQNLIKGLKNNPMSRRHIITAWNPETLDDMALNACHAFVQFNCRIIVWTTEKLYEATGVDDVKDSKVYDYVKEHNLPTYYLDCQLYQRSADSILGVPYNISSYALLTVILAKVCNMIPGEFIHTFGDVHIYENHIPAAKEQLKRECKVLPQLIIKDEGNDWAAISNLDFNLIDMLDISDFELLNYNPHPKLENETKLFTGK